MRSKPAILAVIPARGGSKSIPMKNIRPFCGKPLIAYAIELACMASSRGLIADHVVSTDSSKIARVARSCGGRVPFLRAAHMATDRSPVVDTVAHAVTWWEHSTGRRVHSVLLLQPTHPLTEYWHLEEAIETYLAHQPAARSLISITDAQHIRLSTLYFTRGNRAHTAVRNLNVERPRQSFRPLFWRNGAIYVARRDLVMEDRRIMDDAPFWYLMARDYSCDLDSPLDWEIAEFLFRRNRRTRRKRPQQGG